MNNEKKIYFVGPTESILTKRGNRFPNLAKYLIEQNEDLIYYTSDFYHAEKRFFSKKEIKNGNHNLGYNLKVLKVLGYKTNISPRRVLSNFLFSLNVFFRILFSIRKGDKILIPSRPVELIFFIAILKRIKNIEIYIDIQDIWPDALEIENKTKKKLFEVYCNIYLKPSLKHYTGAFHVAPSFKLWLRRYAKKTPSSFVPLGWENQRWSDVALKEYEEGNVVKMVCVAQLQHQIDVMPILEVLKNNDKLHLTILGEDGTGERYNEVINYININNIRNIKILGKIERNEMVSYLENKDIGVSPMITSSIPNKIFDYMAAMLPIIVLGDNDSSNFVVENQIGWQCNFNSKDLELLLQSLNSTEIKTKRDKVISTRGDFSRDVLHKKIKKLII